MNLRNVREVEFGKDGVASVTIYEGYKDNKAYIVIGDNNGDPIGFVSGKDDPGTIENAVALIFNDPKSLDALIGKLLSCKQMLTDEAYREARLNSYELESEPMGCLVQCFHIYNKKYYMLINEEDYFVLVDKDYFNKNTIKITVVKGFESNERVEKVSNKEFTLVEVVYRIANYSGDTSGRHIRTKRYIYDGIQFFCDGEIVKRLPKQVRCAYEEFITQQN